MKHILPYQISYYEILVNLINNPDKEITSRVGDVRSRFSEKIKVDLKKEFPLMDIKQTSFKNIAVELIWFIKGDTNIKYLVDNKCFIWNDDAFRWYNEKYVPLGAPTVTKEEFVEKTKNGEKLSLSKHGQLEDGRKWVEDINYTYGDLDIVYGRQWRSFGGKVDQLKDVINMLRKNPDDRRMIVLGHNPADIKDGNVGLPACHNYMQVYSQPITVNRRAEIALERGLLEGELKDLVDANIFYKKGYGIQITKETLKDIDARLDALGIEKRYLSCFLNIRSNDFFLGNPYNVASYALLTKMIAQCVGMLPNILSIEMVDCHLYTPHLDAAHEWISRFEAKLEENNAQNPAQVDNTFFCKSEVELNPSIKEIDEFILSDLKITNYSHLGKIQAPLLT